MLVNVLPNLFLRSVTHPLKDLFPPDILQPPIQIPNLLTNLAHLALIRTLDRARLPNRHIQRQFHHARPLPASKPSPARFRGREANPVVAGVGGAECKFSCVRAFGVDDGVVFVEDFVDGYEDAEVGVGGVG